VIENPTQTKTNHVSEKTESATKK